MAYAHRTRVRPVRPVNGARLPICQKGGRSIEPCSPDLRCYGMAISNRVQPQEGTAKWRLGLSRKRQLPPVFTTFLTIFSGIFRESLREGAKWARIRARTAPVQVRTGALKRSTRDARRATVLSCGECKSARLCQNFSGQMGELLLFSGLSLALDERSPGDVPSGPASATKHRFRQEPIAESGVPRFGLKMAGMAIADARGEDLP
jgi:hypothetical protein